ncbi:26S proteasome non-ATPase regulatory subunit 12 [Cavenderia fasciculata]|uniref:26S proteasome non-ATPase regulatory subunit 12 n=1 Tax=Cavenderia fasciculata TaxID=261658 RepID=F4Q424_CACFS|nr:26S proteasome non-ATPase regulatory subunit 12 [Cavenderia fasciculata]EGG16938.1 26S proteasome non-ATPase regulatory subunit 12 [Cavenderia fasciculata]|eukprot:XP_004355412.1 26S proteasome non-ATPase regulatory subunit 12 [Cavenderia fasciculata]
MTAQPMQQDLSNVAEKAIKENRELAKKSLIDAIDQLLIAEKQTRQAEDVPSTSKIAAEIIKLCYEQKRFDLINEKLILLSKRRGQFRPTIKAIVQEAMTYVDITSDMKIKLELIDTLRVITDGKIFVENERARLTRTLSKIKEDEGDISEAAKILQDLQVETYGSMEKREKMQFFIEQMRLCMNNKDFIRAQLIANKVNRKTLAEEENHDLKVEFYKQMIRYYSNEANYLEITRCYLQIYDTPFIQKDQTQLNEVLKLASLNVVLAPMDNEQTDLLNRIYDYKPLNNLPVYKELLNQFKTSELVGWTNLVKNYETELNTQSIFKGDKNCWNDLKKRVVEHNLKVISTYYKRISTKRLSQLLDLSDDESERFISDLVSNKTIFARIDRPAGLVNFITPKDSATVLNGWAQDISSLLDLVEKTNHLIQREFMIHKWKLTSTSSTYDVTIQLVPTCILIIIILDYGYSPLVFAFYDNNIKPIELLQLMSIGNYNPYKVYGIETLVGDTDKMKLILDTQTKTTAVVSTECKDGCLPIEPRYSPSSTSLIEKQMQSGAYTDLTNYLGNEITDQFSFANGTTTKIFTRFVSIISQSKPWSIEYGEASSIKAQGVLGLGYGLGATTFMAQFAKQTNGSEVFALSYCPGNPRIWIGGIDTTVLTDPLTITNLDGGTYGFKIDNVYLGDRTLWQVSDFVYRAIVDAKLPYTLLPSSIFHQTLQFLSKVKPFASKMSTRFFLEKKCILSPFGKMSNKEINEQIPPLRILFNKERNPSELVLDAVPSLFVLVDDMVCPGIVETLDYVISLGGNVLEQYLVLFDQENSRLGFGRMDTCDAKRWLVGNWSKCSLDKQSGCAIQSRRVICAFGRSKVLPESDCADTVRPPSYRNCGEKPTPKPTAPKPRNAPPVEIEYLDKECVLRNATSQWKIVGDWNDCTQICGSGTQKRNVYCIDPYGAVEDDTGKCLERMPADQRLCAVRKCPSEFHWEVSPWSGCSEQCGENGFQNRQSTCIDAATWRSVDTDRCISPPPEVQKKCRGQPMCTLFKWDFEPCEPICSSDDPDRLAYIYCFNTTSNKQVDQRNCNGINNLRLPKECGCKRHRKVTVIDGSVIVEEVVESDSSPATSIHYPILSHYYYNNTIISIVSIIFIFFKLLLF